jgi:hypothetical protein
LFAVLQFAAISAESSEIAERALRIGSRIPRSVSVKDEGLCMSSPGQMDRCIKIVVNTVEFRVAYRRKSLFGGRVITYIHTNDTSFRTLEDLKVGDTVKINDRNNLLAAPGFEVSVLPESGGWEPVVGLNSEVTVVLEDGTDRKVQVSELSSSIDHGITLRITGFTKR